MVTSVSFVLLSIVAFLTAEHHDGFLFGRFPDDFTWGAASSAFDTEGAWDGYGKSESILDRDVHNSDTWPPVYYSDNAADSYHKYHDDIQQLVNMGATRYHFSIAWSRVMPDGSTTNQQAIDHYSRFIDALLLAGITPVVTLYHFDHPQSLEDTEGWLNSTMTGNFVAYAETCFRSFGDRVKHWITINEPALLAVHGYGDDKMPPKRSASKGRDPYKAAHNMILAHALVYRRYEQDFKRIQNGQVGITLTVNYPQPALRTSSDDIMAVGRYLEFNVAWVADPILKGNYPQTMVHTIQNNSVAQGLPASRLPAFSEDEIQTINGTADFIVTRNRWTPVVTNANSRPTLETSFDNDMDVVVNLEQFAKSTVNLSALREGISWFYWRYSIAVFVVDSGIITDGDALRDQQRIDHYRGVIDAVLKASILDNSNVRGFLSWSLLDNQHEGGLVHVDHRDATLRRTSKASTRYLATIIEHNGFVEGYSGPLGITPGVISHENDFYFGTFPDDFMWGTATSSYQTEGGWNEDGKVPSVYDNSAHYDTLFKANTTGDETANSYDDYLRDVEMLESLKIGHYRFSISWSRVMPVNGSVNQGGVQYYHNLINALVAANITPVVTMVHYDWPQVLEDIGGWRNPLVIDYFLQYARVCFTEYGNKVKWWTTFNQPYNIAYYGYTIASSPPGVANGDRNAYTVSRNILIAHARAYQMYQREFKPAQNGKLGIVLSQEWPEPRDALNTDDQEAAMRRMQFKFGMYADPIMLTGDFPELVKQRVAERTIHFNVGYERLPQLTTPESALILNSTDFLGFNFYTANLVSSSHEVHRYAHYDDDQNITLSFDPEWKSTGFRTKKMTPWAIRKMLNWIKNRYNNPDVFILENGVSDRAEGLEDGSRLEALKLYTNEILKAIDLDKCNVIAYTAWSLMDLYEYSRGYDASFGLYQVDFASENRTRTPKASSYYYHDLTEDNGFKYGLSRDGGQPMGEKLYPHDEFYWDTFPDDFIWSTATSAYQIEGAWNLEGKGLSIWDTVANAGLAANGGNGKIACDSYHKYMEDIQLMKDMGVSHYRFSISWPRVLPDGKYQGPDSVNEAGVDYYDRLIDGLLASGIKPMVTLYHWDLPQALQDEYGGWLNETTTHWFVEYSRLCFERFGDRVQKWITFNEPWIVSYLGYGTAAFAPMIRGPGDNVYTVSHNLLRAHGKAYRLFDDHFRFTNGTIGITLNVGYSAPRDPLNPDDVAAAERAFAFDFGWFAEPIYGTGDYPWQMRERVDENSRSQGNNQSRLPHFTDQEKNIIKGSGDFIGLNFYSGSWVESNLETAEEASYDNDKGVKGSGDPNWIGSGSDWLKVTPFYLRSVLNVIKRHYGNPPLYVTENGVSDNNGTTEDYHRIHYYRTYINEMLKAIKLDKCNVKGYTAWSLMDNFEWMRAYEEKFGMVYVNFSDPNRPRTPKLSAKWFAQLITDHGFKKGYTGRNGAGTFIQQEGGPFYGKFPDGFKWSVSTTGFDTSMTDRGPSVWDTFIHNSNNAPIDYTLIKDQIHDAAILGVDTYNIRVDWSRILPSGTKGSLNATGVLFYKNLINDIVAAGIEPVATLFENDFPQALQDTSGWTHSNMTEFFADFADVCFEHFGDKVKIWITFADPMRFAIRGYGEGTYAPGLKHWDLPYPIAHNIIKAHTRVYHLYYSRYKWQNGQVGINLGARWADYTISDGDTRNTDYVMQSSVGWFAQPLLGNGDYPTELRESRMNGFERFLHNSYLPSFTTEEITMNKGSADFLALTVYPVKWVVDGENDYVPNVETTEDRYRWTISVRKLLNWIKITYKNPPVVVVPYGSIDSPSIGQRDDEWRIHYLKTMSAETLKAVHFDECNVIGFGIRTISDSYDWSSQAVAQDSVYKLYLDVNGTQTTLPKSSVRFYNQLITDNGFVKGSITDIPFPWTRKYEDEFYYGLFPSGFIWACATAAYQIEGGYDQDGRGMSIWDTYSHTPGNVDNNDTGDVACDSYHKYREDIKLLSDLKVTDYRFSLSWPRILPKGTLHGGVNELGVEYYNNVINGLIDAGIRPMVTLYHWDLPQALQDHGGWLNETIVNHFGDYARLCYTLFGDRVKYWITLNEPWVVSVLGHGVGQMAPGFADHPGEYPYTVSHHLLKSHALAYHIYDDEFRHLQNGVCGLTLNMPAWCEPKDKHNPDDYEASRRAMDFQIGWFADVVYGTGDYPAVMKTLIAERSRVQGFNKSRLPEFSENEQQYNKGTSDFFGLNFYTSNYVTTFKASTQYANYFTDGDVALSVDPAWQGSASEWLKVTPFGIRKALNWIKHKYGDIAIIITENGVSDKGAIHDTDRRDFYKSYINEVLKAIRLDDVNVVGYTAWSLMDNFEWARGYSERFGLHYVNYSDPERPRTPKLSAVYYRDLITKNGFIKDGQELETTTSVSVTSVAGTSYHTTTDISGGRSTVKIASTSNPVWTPTPKPTCEPCKCPEKRVGSGSVLTSSSIIVLSVLIISSFLCDTINVRSR